MPHFLRSRRFTSFASAFIWSSGVIGLLIVVLRQCPVRFVAIKIFLDVTFIDQRSDVWVDALPAGSLFTHLHAVYLACCHVFECRAPMLWIASVELAEVIVDFLLWFSKRMSQWYTSSFAWSNSLTSTVTPSSLTSICRSSVLTWLRPKPTIPSASASVAISRSVSHLPTFAKATVKFLSKLFRCFS